MIFTLVEELRSLDVITHIVVCGFATPTFEHLIIASPAVGLPLGGADNTDAILLPGGARNRRFIDNHPEKKPSAQRQTNFP